VVPRRRRVLSQLPVWCGVVVTVVVVLPVEELVENNEYKKKRTHNKIRVDVAHLPVAPSSESSCSCRSHGGATSSSCQCVASVTVVVPCRCRVLVVIVVV
jgi:hypothetical protein